MVYSVNSKKIIRIGDIRQKNMLHSERRRRRSGSGGGDSGDGGCLLSIYFQYMRHVLLFCWLSSGTFSASFEYIVVERKQTHTQCVQMRILYLSMRISIFSIRWRLLLFHLHIYTVVAGWLTMFSLWMFLLNFDAMCTIMVSMKIAMEQHSTGTHTHGVRHTNLKLNKGTDKWFQV